MPMLVWSLLLIWKWSEHWGRLHSGLREEGACTNFQFPPLSSEIKVLDPLELSPLRMYWFTNKVPFFCGHCLQTQQWINCKIWWILDPHLLKINDQILIDDIWERQCKVDSSDVWEVEIHSLSLVMCHNNDTPFIDMWHQVPLWKKSGSVVNQGER